MTYQAKLGTGGRHPFSLTDFTSPYFIAFNPIPSHPIFPSWQLPHKPFQYILSSTNNPLTTNWSLREIITALWLVCAFSSPVSTKFCPRKQWKRKKRKNSFKDWCFLFVLLTDWHCIMGECKCKFLCSLITILVLAFLLCGANADNPYRYYTWKVTYGDIYPLGVKQQVLHSCYLLIYSETHTHKHIFELNVSNCVCLDYIQSFVAKSSGKCAAGNLDKWAVSGAAYWLRYKW